MVSIFNPSERTLEFVHYSGTYTFLDNTCQDVPESVAREALTEYPVLQCLTPDFTMDGEQEKRSLTLEEKIEAVPAPHIGDLLTFQHPTDAAVQQTFTKEEMERLGIDPTGTEYWCSFQTCRHTFKTRMEWKSHMRRHEADEAQRIQKVNESDVKPNNYEESSKESSSKEEVSSKEAINESIHEGGQSSGQEGVRESSKKEKVIKYSKYGKPLGRPIRPKPQPIT